MMHKLISKSVFFPKQGILAIGDLHLGYEQMLNEQGITLPFNQLETTQKDIEEIINKIGKSKIKRIILLGDIKHHFHFEKGEMFYVRSFMNFLEKFVPEESIILIKGNHDQVRLYRKKYYDVYVEDSIAFTHGHENFPGLFSKEIKTIVMSHIHPAILLKDRPNIKREKYKCFLIGEYLGKRIIIVPSFFPMLEGSEIGKEDYGIIPAKDLEKFNVFVVGENQVYDFGVSKSL